MEILKLQVASTPTVAYFNLNLPITVTCDASQNGLGTATDSDVMPGSYASRNLTDTEHHYVQIEKELLAVVKDFIFGKTITVETDHQPLVTILNKPIHATAAHLQRMMMQLQLFDFRMVYKKGKDMHIADTLSRAPHTTREQHPIEQDQFSAVKVSFVPTDWLRCLAEHTVGDKTS